MNKKMGWSVYGILGFIFAQIGIPFLVLGMVLGQPGGFVRWRSVDDPVVFTAVSMVETTNLRNRLMR